MHLKFLMIHLVRDNQKHSRLKSYHVYLRFCFWEQKSGGSKIVDLDKLVLKYGFGKLMVDSVALLRKN